MRLVVALALLAAACESPRPPAPADGFVAAACYPTSTSVCQVLVDLPQLGITYVWTCTTGVGHPEEGKPDHRPCEVCSPLEPMWCETGTGSCVRDCSTCTPDIVEKLEPTQQCAPADPWWPPPWEAPDLAGQPIEPP